MVHRVLRVPIEMFHHGMQITFVELGPTLTLVCVETNIVCARKYIKTDKTTGSIGSIT